MKRIVILTCLRASEVCTGASCFAAFNGRAHRFADYGGEPLELCAFMRCSGCGHFPGEDRGLDEKIRRICAMKPDAVHAGICCCENGRGKELCPEIEAILRLLAEAGIRTVRGTHSKF